MSRDLDRSDLMEPEIRRVPVGTPEQTAPKERSGR